MYSIPKGGKLRQSEEILVLNKMGNLAGKLQILELYVKQEGLGDCSSSFADSSILLSRVVLLPLCISPGQISHAIDSSTTLESPVYPNPGFTFIAVHHGLSGLLPSQGLHAGTSLTSVALPSQGGGFHNSFTTMFFMTLMTVWPRWHRQVWLPIWGVPWFPWITFSAALIYSFLGAEIFQGLFLPQVGSLAGWILPWGY